MYISTGDGYFDLDTSFSTMLRYRCKTGKSAFEPHLDDEDCIELLYSALQGKINIYELREAYRADDQLRLSALILHAELLRTDISVDMQPQNNSEPQGRTDELAIVAMCILAEIDTVLIKTLSLYQLIGLIHEMNRMRSGAKEPEEMTGNKFRDFYGISDKDERLISELYRSEHNV